MHKTLKHKIWYCAQQHVFYSTFALYVSAFSLHPAFILTCISVCEVGKPVSGNTEINQVKRHCAHDVQQNLEKLLKLF